MAAKAKKDRAILFILVLLWAVGASGAAIWLFLHYRGPGDYVRRLSWLAQRAGYEWRGGSPDLPDRSSSARHWLLSLVQNPHEDFDLRHQALACLVNMENGPAWVHAMRDLLNWADPPVEAPPDTPPDYRLAAYVKRYVLLRVLLVAAPEGEVLEILKRAAQGGWRTFLEAQAHRPADAPSPLLPEYQARATARAREILAYADSAVHTSAPPEAQGR